VENSLHALGYEGINRVWVGKYMEVELAAGSREEAEKLVEDMSERLLSNPVIEDYGYTLEEA